MSEKSQDSQATWKDIERGFYYIGKNKSGHQIGDRFKLHHNFRESEAARNSCCFPDPDGFRCIAHKQR